MASADYQTALKNGIDAARSGSRMMARLHLLKAADLAPQDVAAPLWLAWVAETPADALAHLDEALSRQGDHRLARLGRLWTQLMQEFDPSRDYSQCDLGYLRDARGESPAGQTTAPNVEQVDDVAQTQRLSGLTIVERREKKPRHADDANDSQASAPPGGSEPERHAPLEPLDLTRTVRMDLLQRERPDETDEPSPALTCVFSPKQTAPQTTPQDNVADEPAPSPAAGEPSTTQGVHDELPSTGTIRLDPNAVKRALAETVIAEMISPEYAAPVPGAVGEGAAEDTAEPEHDAQQVAAAASISDSGTAPPRFDAYTEPPKAALSPDDRARDNDNAAQPANGPRVLIVDDSPTVRKLVTATLEAQGYRVACAASGYEAVEILAHATPDALVIEVDLPRLDGLHLCKLLRSNDATRQTPVIFLTRRNGTMDRMRGKMVGATAYLTKPFRSLALIEEMTACCPVGRS
ncbi:MAG: hypothetical protein DCC68_06105 [Planctomycetota bacterium]|nr:MAG: hypothetical protein DCC68_06105 [Planctomycetota bacterium]